ncbi:MAG: hypothetical protein L0Y42_13700 [Phycisphaerales bacterium]|nr:hypothetical protein [Phycisphaerales bacterium]
MKLTIQEAKALEAHAWIPARTKETREEGFIRGALPGFVIFMPLEHSIIRSKPASTIGDGTPLIKQSLAEVGAFELLVTVEVVK